MTYFRAWTVKKVVGHEKKAEVESECHRLSGGARNGSRDWIAVYQAALKTVTDNLTSDELKDYQQKAKDWTEKSPPENEQRR